MKNRITQLVLVAEIAAICILHAVKHNQTEKNTELQNQPISLTKSEEPTVQYTLVNNLK